MIPAKIPWSNKMILILKKVLASDLCKNLSQLDHRKHEMNFFNLTGLERTFFTYLRNDINDPTFLHMEKGLFWPVVTCDKAFLFFRAREVRWMKNSKFENKKQKRQQQKNTSCIGSCLYCFFCYLRYANHITNLYQQCARLLLQTLQIANDLNYNRGYMKCQVRVTGMRLCIYCSVHCSSWDGQ